MSEMSEQENETGGETPTESTERHMVEETETTEVEQPVDNDETAE